MSLRESLSDTLCLARNYVTTPGALTLRPPHFSPTSEMDMNVEEATTTTAATADIKVDEAKTAKRKRAAPYDRARAKLARVENAAHGFLRQMPYTPERQDRIDQKLHDDVDTKQKNQATELRSKCGYNPDTGTGCTFVKHLHYRYPPEAIRAAKATIERAKADLERLEANLQRLEAQKRKDWREQWQPHYDAIAAIGNGTQADTIQIELKPANVQALEDEDAFEHEFQIDISCGRIINYGRPQVYDSKTPIPFPASIRVQNIGGCWHWAAEILALLAQNRGARAYRARERMQFRPDAFHEYVVLCFGKKTRMQGMVHDIQL